MEKQEPNWTQEQLYQEFELLLDRALHRRGWISHHECYLDLKHELYFKLYELACKFNGDLFQAPDRFRFVRFASVGLDRYLLNLLTRQQHPVVLNDDLLDAAPDGMRLDSQVQVDFFWQALEEVVDPAERQLVELLLDEQLTHTQRAKRLGISRKAYYLRRQQLMRKLLTAKGELSLLAS